MTEYRIDDLAQASGTTTRNIRGYQERGLLPQPLRRGRVAIYTDRHLKRLGAISKLLSDGFTMNHISAFLAGLQRGAGLADVLELSDVLEERWSNPRGGVVAVAELARKLDTPAAELTALLEEAGLATATKDPARIAVTDLDLVDGYADLIARGMKLATLLQIYADVNQQLDRAAATLIGAARAEVTRQRGAGWLPTTDEQSRWAADLVNVMRRTGTRFAHNSLDRALDETLRNELREYQASAEPDRGVG